MALTETQQLEKLLESSKYILLLFNPKDNGDALCAALALKMLLEKKHKQAEIASSGFVLPKHLNFLTSQTDIKSTLTHLQKFIIKVDVTNNPIDTLSYDVKDNTLSIYLTPKSGSITKNELRTAQSTFKYDLIVTIGITELESLGEIYENNTDLFFRVPVANIDHQSSNENFGQINLIDLNASCASEIVYNFIKQTGDGIFDKTNSTALFAGMTLATKSFKSPNVTPLTLQIAGQLVNHGAEREKVIQHLYRTRPLTTLKLWGQALSHLKYEPQSGLVWTALTRDDFARSGAEAKNLPGIIDELISNSPEAKVVALFCENEQKDIDVLVATEKNYDAMFITKDFKPVGNRRQVNFTITNKSLTDTETDVTDKITANIILIK